MLSCPHHAKQASLVIMDLVLVEHVFSGKESYLCVAA